jgi:hypothetical protein
MMEVAMIGRDSVVGVCAALDGEASLTDVIVVASGTASVLKAEDAFRQAGVVSDSRFAQDLLLIAKDVL